MANARKTKIQSVTMTSPSVDDVVTTRTLWPPGWATLCRGGRHRRCHPTGSGRVQPLPLPLPFRGAIRGILRFSEVSPAHVEEGEEPQNPGNFGGDPGGIRTRDLDLERVAS